MNTGDDIMVIVEPFHGKHYDEVLVRYVFEAHPQMRLDKLLLRCRFDDAENIAKRYNLDVEKIHIARVLDMLNQFGTNAVENSELMARVKPYLDQITDHNEVGDLCVNAVTVVPAYQVILDFLDYAATRNIDDIETKRQLSQFSYDLASFSIIGDCTDHFDPDLWKRFVGTHDEVLTLFESLWATEQPAASRIIWARYKARICQFYEEQDQRVFDLMRELLIKSFGGVPPSWVPQICKESGIPLAAALDVASNEFQNDRFWRTGARLNYMVGFVKYVCDQVLGGRLSLSYTEKILTFIGTLILSVEPQPGRAVNPLVGELKVYEEQIKNIV